MTPEGNSYISYILGVIFDKFQQLTELFLKLEDMKVNDGKNLKNFKKLVSCWNGTDEKTQGCDMIQIAESDHVQYRGIMLSPKGAQDGIPKLSEIRNSTLERIKEELSEYFPHMDDLEAFAVLDPSNFPSGTNLGWNLMKNQMLFPEIETFKYNINSNS